MVIQNMSNEGRTPCPNQGEGAMNKDLFTDEDNPCLICSGNVKSNRSKYFVCPFTLSDKDRTHAVFKDRVNTTYITDAERTFEAQQRENIRDCR